ncbi:MAG: heavy-metal-associated domain-containing protein [Chitinophagaceae bacterium]
MKTLKIVSLALCCALFTIPGIAQKTSTESVAVSGNCGMCKTTIEKAAKKAGASEASWDMDGKKLTVTYAAGKTDLASIQQAVAAAGYDTRDVKASDEAYNKLHACCKYDRASAASNSAMHCQADCKMKDGKCQDMEACKAKGCCKDEEACKAKGCCQAKEGASCCTDGKQAGHDSKTCTKDCCKKA